MKLKTSAMAMMPHQRRMDPILREAGYTFERNSQGHNRYVNEAGQHVTVPGSPKNRDHSKRHILAEIKRNESLLEASKMPATQTQIDPVDLYLTLADPFILKTPTNKNGQSARKHAAIAFTKRVCERYAPLLASDLTRTLERIGYTTSNVRYVKNEAGVCSYRVQNPDGTHHWMNCLNHQVPEGVKIRSDQLQRGIPQHDVQVEAPEPTVETPNGDEPLDLTPLPKVDPKTGEVNAAAIMLLESLGMKMPGQDAKDALKQAHDALTAAGKAVLAAQVEVSRAQASLA